MVDTGDDHDVPAADTSLQVSLQEHVRAAAVAGDRDTVMHLLSALRLEFPGAAEGFEEGVRRKSDSSPDASRA